MTTDYNNYPLASTVSHSTHNIIENVFDSRDRTIITVFDPKQCAISTHNSYETTLLIQDGKIGCTGFNSICSIIITSNSDGTHNVKYSGEANMKHETITHSNESNLK